MHACVGEKLIHGPPVSKLFTVVVNRDRPINNYILMTEPLRRFPRMCYIDYEKIAFTFATF